LVIVHARRGGENLGSQIVKPLSVPWQVNLAAFDLCRLHSHTHDLVAFRLDWNSPNVLVFEVLNETRT